MKRKILFVDDERDLLEALKSRLRGRRKVWDMSFAQGGEEALHLLDGSTFDVVVTDIRMPGMDGVALLELVRSRHPAMARLVLSGHADEASMVKAIALAHQVLAKPCDSGVLEDAVERACELQGKVQDARVREAVGSIGELPVQPRTYLKLMETLDVSDSAAKEVARVVSEDSALTAQVIHVVNSAYFRPGRPITSIEEATIFLGLSTIRQVVLVAELFAPHQVSAVSDPQLRPDKLQVHAIHTGRVASSLFESRAEAEKAFVAGLLHDVGKLVLSLRLQERASAIVENMHDTGRAMADVERDLFGVTHAEIGAHLLGLWEIPLDFVETVAHHHEPRRASPQHQRLVSAVHLADALVHEHSQQNVSTEPKELDVDEESLSLFGGIESLPRWRALTCEFAREASAPRVPLQ